MTEFRLNPEKPLAIIAVCVIGLINATQMINLVLSPMAKQMGAIYPVYFLLSIIASLVCIGGLWLLKRWSALVYGAILFCNQAVLLTMGLWEFTAVVMPLIIIVLLFRHFNEMS